MKVDIVTIFPDMLKAPLAEGVLGRAIAGGLLDLVVHDLRDFADDRHRTVDDVPFGGGPGMVLKPAPLFCAVEKIASVRGRPDAVVLLTPDGRRFAHDTAVELSRLGHVVLLCGRYEGVDERVRAELATMELSIGDYVLTGGELPALVVVDAVARFVPGVVGDEQSVLGDTFAGGLLDFPQYTRPAEFRGLSVPQVLLSGHHAEIRRWREREAIGRTLDRRPEMLARAGLDQRQRQVVQQLLKEREKGVDDGRDGTR